jgi:hypothetical protein
VQPEVRPGEHLRRLVILVAGRARDELGFLGRVEILEVGFAAPQVHAAWRALRDADGHQPGHCMPVPGLDHEVCHSPRKRINHHLPHRAAWTVLARCVRADGERHCLRHGNPPALPALSRQA